MQWLKEHPVTTVLIASVSLLAGLLIGMNLPVV